MDSLSYDRQSDFKLSLKLLNEYQKIERQIQLSLSDLISQFDKNSEIIFTNDNSNILIKEIKKFFVAIALGKDEQQLLEMKKQNMQNVIHFIQTQVLKDDILIFDFSSTK